MRVARRPARVIVDRIVMKKCIRPTRGNHLLIIIKQLPDVLGQLDPENLAAVSNPPSAQDLQFIQAPGPVKFDLFSALGADRDGSVGFALQAAQANRLLVCSFSQDD